MRGPAQASETSRFHLSEFDAVITMPTGPGVLAVTEEALRAEFDAGRMRREWTWVAGR